MKATREPTYSPSPVPFETDSLMQWRIIQGPHATNVNALSQLGVDVPHAAHMHTILVKLDVFSNLGIGEMSLKLCPSSAPEWPCFEGTRPQSHICRISCLSTATRSTKKKMFALDVILPHDSQTVWPRPTQRFKPKWLTRCKKFWKNAKSIEETQHLS